MISESSAPEEVTRAPSESSSHSSELVSVEGEMTIYRAVELRDLLLAAVEQRPEVVEIDLSSVTELDSAGVQLLLLAKRTANAQDKAFEIVGQSAPVLRVLALLNLTSYFSPPAFVLFGDEEGS